VQRYQEILNYNKHMKTAMIATIIMVGNVILVDDPRLLLPEPVVVGESFPVVVVGEPFIVLAVEGPLPVLVVEE
jgi:hypothetical protein